MSHWQRRTVFFITWSLILPVSVMAQSFRLSLDGTWMFMRDAEKVGIDRHWYAVNADRSGWSEVPTPAFWEHYPTMATYDGWGWFARNVTVPDTAADLSLHFAGVDDDAAVWVNGVEAGSHTGYSDPFALTVTPYLKKGENLVVVLVKDHGGGGGIYRPVTLIETARLDDLLRGPYFGSVARPSADWVRDAIMYSAYVRSASVDGTFAGLQARLGELREMGVTVLWLMPIHPVGVKNRKGTLGSPYAVRDYYGINPEFGTMEDFRNLLVAAHAHGMKLIIDLVANHTSWDSKLITDHPEWFSRDAQGRIVPPNEDWTDVADLDYSHATLRASMITMMIWWVMSVGIDGFRCDVAELVPTDFWDDARRRLDALRPVMMLSEGSIPEHHAQAFDLTYSWNIYDAIAPVLAGKRPTALFDQILRNERLQFPTGSLRLRFATNHDKNAWDAPAIKKFGAQGVRLANVLAYTLPGVPLIYTGEEVSNDKPLSLFEKVDVDWSRPRDMADFFSLLAKLRASHPALRTGEMTRVDVEGNESVYGFIRHEGNDRALVLLNFSSLPARVNVGIPPSFSPMGLVGDFFSGEVVEIPSAEWEVTLKPHEYRVMVSVR